MTYFSLGTCRRETWGVYRTFKWKISDYKIHGRIVSNFDGICWDRRCNDLEKWLIEKGYSQREVWKQILRARSFSRDSLLDGENTRHEQNKITLNDF